MRHAYLILCHTDLQLLHTLVSILDDSRNDIFIHIDKKAAYSGTDIIVKKAGLYVLEQRMDARWGDYSLVRVELLLFETAHNEGNYAYYHLLSGADLPLKSQDDIHQWCNAHPGIEYIGFSGAETDGEALWRAQHYFPFSHCFRSNNLLIRIVRKTILFFQDIFSLKRHVGMVVKKGPQWCSVTHDFVSYLLQNKIKVKQMFSHTYCPDELFIQTVCWNSPFREKLYDPMQEFKGCMRYIQWVDGALQDMDIATVKDALLSNRWFARKFNSLHSEEIKMVLANLS